uniref:Putative secreted peptide n=1 Tax=Anopheles braziliensis TaxID=58242 RepID=A0A2M3ZMR4_9DIPT
MLFCLFFSLFFFCLVVYCIRVARRCHPSSFSLAISLYRSLSRSLSLSLSLSRFPLFAIHTVAGVKHNFIS